MNVWAGADQVEQLPARPWLSRLARLRSAGLRRLREAPTPGSVHRVNDVLHETACGRRDITSLVRLRKPWAAWPAMYRCRVCDAVFPGGAPRSPRTPPAEPHRAP